MSASERIRRAVRSLESRGRGSRYPSELQAELVAYTRAQRESGVGLKEIGREVDVPWRTLARWSIAPRRARGQRAFRRVEVDAVASGPVSLSVSGPHGLRIDGLDLDGIAELLRRLG